MRIELKAIEEADFGRELDQLSEETTESNLFQPLWLPQRSPFPLHGILVQLPQLPKHEPVEAEQT